MKVTSGLDLVRDYLVKMENETEEEIQDKIEAYEWEEEMKIRETREKLYKKLSIEERAKPETRAWFDKLTFYKYDEHNAQVLKTLNEQIAYIESEKLSNDEITAYLRKERQETKKELIKTPIGRELLLDYKEEFFLQLFNDTKMLTVQNDSGKTFHFNKELSAEISEVFAEYTAIDRVYQQYSPEIPEQPHLKHITISTIHYETIIYVLADMKLVDSGTNEWKKRNLGYKRLIANLIWELRHMGMCKKVKMTEELVMSIAKKTFNVELSKRTSQTDDLENLTLNEITRNIEKKLAKRI